jgi:hypothetical protein
MEFLGIGLPELFFIVLIALIVLGPRDMEKAGRTIGTWLRRLVTSDEWRVWKQTLRHVGTLPNKWMREANEEFGKIDKEVKGIVTTDEIPGEDARDIFGSWSGKDVTARTSENNPDDTLKMVTGVPPPGNSKAETRNEHA